MAYPYHYEKHIGNIGVGVENLGFQMPTTLPAYDGWMRPRYQVKGQLDPQMPGYVKYGQSFVPVSLVGNGTALHGTVELQKLAQLLTGKN